MLADAAGDAAKLREVVRERAAGVELTEAEAAEAIADRWKYAPAGFLSRTIAARLGVYFAFPLEDQDTMPSTQGHDGCMVPIYAVGPGAERFAGTIDNTEVAAKLRDLLLGPGRESVPKKDRNIPPRESFFQVGSK
jgi:hypothetical protein